MTQSPWTVRSLKAELEAVLGPDTQEASIRVVEGAEPILLVTMRDYGDLEIFVSVGDQQIAASVLLWPVDEQPNRAEFNEFLLKAQKLVPLSNFGISTVSGRDYYELFGELSTTSSVSDVLIELRMLAENAIEAASDLRTAFAPA